MKSLEELIKSYKKTYIAATLEPLMDAFGALADKIIAHQRTKKAFAYINDHEAKCRARMVFAAIIRLHRYKEGHNAHNYFLIIMDSELRQLCQTQKNYKQLKQKYYDYLDEQKRKNN